MPLLVSFDWFLNNIQILRIKIQTNRRTQHKIYRTRNQYFMVFIQLWNNDEITRENKTFFFATQENHLNGVCDIHVTLTIYAHLHTLMKRMRRKRNKINSQARFESDRIKYKLQTKPTIQSMQSKLFSITVRSNRLKWDYFST